MSRLTATVLAALALLCAGAAFAADPSALLPAGWSHAQINVIGPKGRPHTLIYDRGRVQSVTPSSLTLLERDGSVVTIQVSATAVVRVNGQPGSLAQVQPGFNAMTFGIDGNPAQRVQANQPVKPVVVRPALKRVTRRA
jgi:hypothetical protein